MHNDQTPSTDPVIALCTLAIERRAAVRVRYNGGIIELHPHQLVERNGATYLRAVNPAKARRSDEELSLGLFHLAGLSDLTLCGHGFEPLEGSMIEPARSTDRTVATV